MKRILIIFAKEPKKNNIKTRLSNVLSQKKRLSLYKAFLKDTINLGKGIKASSKILAYDSGKNEPIYLSKIGKGFVLYKQKGKDLGKKIHNAFLYAKSKKRSKVVIIGSDSPTLPQVYIENAFRILNKKDIVLGPSLDGGYYLVGLKKPCFLLFKDIKWSTNSVLKDTIKKARKLHKSLAILEMAYDIDRAKDLVKLRSDLKRQKNKKNARWTRKFLRV